MRRLLAHRHGIATGNGVLLDLREAEHQMAQAKYMRYGFMLHRGYFSVEFMLNIPGGWSLRSSLFCFSNYVKRLDRACKASVPALVERSTILPSLFLAFCSPLCQAKTLVHRMAVRSVYFAEISPVPPHGSVL